MKPSFFSSRLILFLFFVATLGCKDSKDSNSEMLETAEATEDKAPFFKLSLAQWSLHRTFNDEGVSSFKFAEISKDMGFQGLEYVNHLYKNQIDSLGFDTVIDSLKVLSEKHGMENVLIMVDGEGDLASPDEAERNQAVENHKKWVDAAKKLRCHSIRVNTFGSKDLSDWIPSVVDGLKKLSAYALTQNINILCENHGWLSSDADALMEVIDMVNMNNCGTLPDFGNWCVKRKDGEKWGECIEEYPDKYKGIQLMLPRAKAVSAKSYDFGENGDETTLDFLRIMQMVKDSKYTGFVGVEYEGNRLTEKEGIEATKALLLKCSNSIN